MAVNWTDPETNEQLTGVVGVEQFFSAVNLQPNQFARCHIKAAGSTIDHVVVNVYGRVKTSGAAGDDWTTAPVHAYTTNPGETPSEIEFVVEKAYQFRIGVIRSGSTDTFTVDLDHRIATQS